MPYFDAVDPCICQLLPGRECPDDLPPVRCDDCAGECLEPHSGEDHKICCRCLQRSYDRNAPKGWQVEKCAICKGGSDGSVQK